MHTAIYNIIFTRRYLNPQYAIGRSETSITRIEMQVHKYKESRWEGSLVSLGGSQGNETERPPAVSVELHPTRYRQNMTFTIDHNKSIYLIGRTFLGRINWNIYLCFCIFFLSFLQQGLLCLGFVLVIDRNFLCCWLDLDLECVVYASGS